jgi:hypothetical protein
MNTMTRGALRGKTLQNGALCIESWQVNQDEHVVLALREHSVDPYVVWTATEDGNCSRGDYCRTIQEAIKAAERRAGL